MWLLYMYIHVDAGYAVGAYAAFKKTHEEVLNLFTIIVHNYVCMYTCLFKPYI